MDDVVIECEGLNGGSLLSKGDGYFYCVTIRKESVWYLLCKTRACRGRAKLVLFNGEKKFIRETCPHSAGCEPDFLFSETVLLRKKIKERCEEGTVPLVTVFNEECNR
jgi:hypothetical protein